VATSLPKNSTIKPLPGDRRGQQKKDRKTAKNTENSTIKPLPGNQRGTNGKKDRKIAVLRLYLLYLYHEWKSRRGTASLTLAADAHDYGHCDA